MTFYASPGITVDVHCGDALSFKADVLALKHARESYGVDREVVRALTQRGVDISPLLPKEGSFHLLPSQGVVRSESILFVGTAGLYDFDYEAIRNFARRVLELLAMRAPRTKHVALTLHGVGFGLDEAEAFKAEVAGVLDAVQEGACPPSLERVTVVEFSRPRAERLEKVLSSLAGLPTPHLVFDADAAGAPDHTRQSLDAVGAGSRDKSHVFVAMPFAPEFEDLYHYGIYGAVKAAGYLCERADLSVFTGDVMSWVKERIASASLLVADLSSANPNVYLEVGYAWGKDVPTVLLANDKQHLKFDVQGQRCLLYRSIRHLEESLTHELKALRTS